MSDLLKTYLGNTYAADVLGKGKFSDALASFKTAVELNSDLRAEAQKELQRVQELHENRCFVSRKHLLYLHHVLS